MFEIIVLLVQINVGSPNKVLEIYNSEAVFTTLEKCEAAAKKQRISISWGSLKQEAYCRPVIVETYREMHD